MKSVKILQYTIENKLLTYNIQIVQPTYSIKGKNILTIINERPIYLRNRRKKNIQVEQFKNRILTK